MDSAYKAAKAGRTAQGFAAWYPADPNAFVSSHLGVSQAENRKLVQQTSYGAMYKSALSKYVIGAGLSPVITPRTGLLVWSKGDYDRFTSEASEFWSLFSGKGIHDAGLYPFKRLQKLAFEMALESGDVLLHRFYARGENYRPKIQLISGARVFNPEMADRKSGNIAGVEYDRKGREVAYWIHETDDNLMDTNRGTRVSRFNRAGFEEFTLIRPFITDVAQARGVPFLTKVQSEIVNLTAFDQAYIYKAMVSSLLSMIIQRDKDAPAAGATVAEKIAELGGIGGNGMRGAGGDFRESVDDAAVSLGYGNVIQLEDGESATTVESKTQGSDYKTFIESRLDVIGGALGVPTEMAMGRFGSSFSAARGTIGTSEKGFQPLRQAFADSFCAPVYEMVVDYGIRLGYIHAPGYFDDDVNRKAVLAHSWMGPNQVVVNPTQEVGAFVNAVNAGFIDRGYATRQLYGEEYSAVLDRIEQENAEIAGRGTQQAPAGGEEEKGNDEN